MRRRLARILACAACLLPGPIAALERGVTTSPPVAVSAAAPIRQALIVAPASGGGAIAADADAYAASLRLLGFSVTTILAETRPDLEGGLRRFAAGVRPGADVAILLLGTLPARAKTLYLTATMPSPDLLAHPDLLATEGVAMSDVVARIEAQGPKDVVAIVEICRATDGASDCRQAAAALPDGVSALIASRLRGDGAGAPLARLASLRPDLEMLMRQPGLSFFALFAALKEKLAGTDMTLVATPSLTRSFAFLPGDFLAKLPTACNRVTATSDPADLQGLQLESFAPACAEAARTYGFSPFFREKLEIVREQIAFQRTTSARCDAMAAAAYLHDFPGGHLRAAVERSRSDCEAEQRQAAAAGSALAAQREQALRDDAAREEARQRLKKTNGLVERGDIQPSFPCTPDLREPVAQLICADADLAAADAELGAAYRQAFAETAPIARHPLAQSQIAWLRQRTAGCGIPTTGSWDIDVLAPMKACLLQTTQQRTAALGR